jgi:hypothetical protein
MRKRPFAREYAALRRKIAGAGFEAHLERTRDGLWRLLCNRIREGYLGAVFWCVRRRSGWFVCTWANRYYLLPDRGRIAEFSLHVLRGPRGTHGDFDGPVKVRYRLIEVDDV